MRAASRRRSPAARPARARLERQESARIDRAGYRYKRMVPTQRMLIRRALGTGMTREHLPAFRVGETTFSDVAHLLDWSLGNDARSHSPNPQEPPRPQHVPRSWQAMRARRDGMDHQVGALPLGQRAHVDRHHEIAIQGRGDGPIRLTASPPASSKKR